MNKFLIVVVVILILPIVLVNCGLSKKEKIHSLLMSAKEKIYLNDFDAAWEDLEKCHKLEKDHPEVYFLKGNLYMLRVEYDDAMEMYNKAIEIDPNYTEAYINRGKLWFYLGDTDKRCDDYLKAESLGARNLHEDTKFCR